MNPACLPRKSPEDNQGKTYPGYPPCILMVIGITGGNLPGAAGNGQNFPKRILSLAVNWFRLSGEVTLLSRSGE